MEVNHPMIGKKEKRSSQQVERGEIPNGGGGKKPETRGLNSIHLTDLERGKDPTNSMKRGKKQESGPFSKNTHDPFNIWGGYRLELFEASKELVEK